MYDTYGLPREPPPELLALDELAPPELPELEPDDPPPPPDEWEDPPL